MNSNLGYNKAKTYNPFVVPKLHSYYHLTSNYRISPKFFIIGVQKGGTTSLCQYLQSHKQIIPPQRKDIYFFNNETNYSKGLKWYRAHFALGLYKELYDKWNRVDAMTFDGTPNYFDQEGSGEKIKTHFPNAKIILLLRNPIDRAWSNYQMAKRFGFETLSFEESLKLEDIRLQEGQKLLETTGEHNYIHQRLTYKKKGLYTNYIDEWIMNYKPENILILSTEEFEIHTKSVYQKICEFLEISVDHNCHFLKYNEGKYQVKMIEKTRQELQEYYKPFNESLFKKININFGW